MWVQAARFTAHHQLIVSAPGTDPKINGAHGGMQEKAYTNRTMCANRPHFPQCPKKKAWMKTVSKESGQDLQEVELHQGTREQADGEGDEEKQQRLHDEHAHSALPVAVQGLPVHLLWTWGSMHLCVQA